MQSFYEGTIIMSVTSMVFLLLFLPASLIIYYIVPARFRDFVLLAVSLLFYAIGSLRYIFIFAGSIVLTVWIGRWMHASGSRAVRRILLIAGTAANTGILGYYKYTDFVLASVNKVTGAEIPLRNMLLPLGISFFTFKAISYLADIYMERTELDKNPLHDALYLSFFAQIQSGPLARYQEMSVPAEFRGSRSARFYFWRAFSAGIGRGFCTAPKTG